VCVCVCVCVCVVLVIQHAKRMRRIAVCGSVVCSLHICHNGYDFERDVVEHKIWVRFFLQQLFYLKRLKF
jgi:hypothetical protein